MKLELLKYRAKHYFFLVYFAGCLAGCLYQIYEFSDIYFSYRTSTQIDVFITDSARYPGVIICFPYLNLIKENKENMTISQIFRQSPKPEEALIQCKITSANGRMETHNITGCIKYFAPTKHFRGSLLCYRFLVSSKIGYTYSVSTVTNVIYDLYFSLLFKSWSSIYVFSYSYPTFRADQYEKKKAYPYLGSRYGNIVVRSSKSINMITFRNKVHEYIRLPKPYDTQCTDRGIIGYFDCLTLTMNNTVHRYPFNSITSEPIDIQPLVLDDLLKPDILHALDAAYLKCIPLYLTSVCRAHESITGIDYFSSKYETGLQVTAATPLSAMISLASYPSLLFSDLLYYVSGSISFWFGLSVMYFNPSKAKNILSKVKFCTSHKIHLTISLLFITGCIIGFLIHINIAAVDYFEFKTSSALTFESNDTLRYPSALVCFNFHFDEKNGLSFDSNNGEENALHPTVKQIFDLTPAPQNFITSCSLNDDLNASLVLTSKEKCLNFLSIKKAVSGSSVCYQVVPQTGLYYIWARFAVRLRQSNEIYGIYLNESFNNADFITITYYHSGDIEGKNMPIYSRHYSKRFISKPGLDKTSFHNFLGVYAEHHHYLGQPPPYYPACDDRNNSHECLRKCLLESYIPLRRVPNSELIYEASHFKTLQFKDMEKNITLNRLFTNIGAGCRAKCSRLPCDFRVSFTEGQDFSVPNFSQFLVRFFTPTAPELIITIVPWKSLQDFLLYLSNCIGIWFGISVLSLNPSNLFKRRS